jgi:hypothetical protein
LLKGLATFVPGVRGLANRGSGGTTSARYCYAVWMRHLVQLADAGLPTTPRRIAELGPGDSLGIGLAAMLSGADEYYAFDARPHASPARNQRILHELVTLFRTREPIPGELEFPLVQPRLACYAFPANILSAERLSAALAPERVAAIAAALGGGGDAPIRIGYVAPWDAATLLRPGTIDLALSQAVLEHVEDVGATYRALAAWLAEDGVVSHAIDFQSHGLTREWYGHWTVGDIGWRVLKGTRPYLINRVPCSEHLAGMRQAGFRIVRIVRERAPAAPRHQLAERFAALPDQDLDTSSAYVQARKITPPAEPR